MTRTRRSSAVRFPALGRNRSGLRPVDLPRRPKAAAAVNARSSVGPCRYNRGLHRAVSVGLAGFSRQRPRRNSRSARHRLVGIHGLAARCRRNQPTNPSQLTPSHLTPSHPIPSRPTHSNPAVISRSNRAISLRPSSAVAVVVASVRPPAHRKGSSRPCRRSAPKRRSRCSSPASVLTPPCVPRALGVAGRPTPW